MSHDHREAIAEVLYGLTWTSSLADAEPVVRESYLDRADALLGSDVLAQIRAEARAEGLREFAAWVATNRAYNGSEHKHAQALYNECLNVVLPTWAAEFAVEGSV